MLKTTKREEKIYEWDMCKAYETIVLGSNPSKLILKSKISIKISKISRF